MKRVVAASIAAAALAVPASAAAATTDPCAEPGAVPGVACPEQAITAGPVALVTGLDGGPTDGGTLTYQRQRIASTSTLSKKAHAASKRKHKRHRRHR